MINFSNLLNRLIYFILYFAFISVIFVLILFPIYTANEVIIPYAIHPFNICEKNPNLWLELKKLYILVSIVSNTIIFNSIYNFFHKKHLNKAENKSNNQIINSHQLNLLIGKNKNNENVYIEESGLFQNILITGTIGSGKTSSAMYPFTKQLIEYKANDFQEKICMLILDVKGNYYTKVKEFASEFNRKDDLIIIDANGSFKYNPLDKPNLKASVLANRLKTILTLFSSNNGEAYWLDKCETILTECIKFCRLYNNGYVTFEEIHKLVTITDYFESKIPIVKKLFQNNLLNNEDSYNLLTCIDFFEKEFKLLDSRTLAILKSEITRITNVFISDYKIFNTFCSKKEDLNFYGFEEAIKNGKIVVLNMNIAEYKNLSKIIAAYLKLDFQSEILSQLSKNNLKIRKSAFISDEYHEYVTLTDSDFFSQSREAKCINIVATQSYTSLLNTLKDESNVKVIIQNLVNKLWFRTDDIYTIEEAQKQIGKEEKEKSSKTISENAKETNYNFLFNKFTSNGSNLSESINTYSQFDYIYDTNYFSQNLETFSCLSFLSNGYKITPPQKLNMLPYFKLKNKTKKINLKGFDLNEK